MVQMVQTEQMANPFFKSYDNCLETAPTSLKVTIGIVDIISLLIVAHYCLVVYTHYLRADHPVVHGGCPKDGENSSERNAVEVAPPRMDHSSVYQGPSQC